MDERGFYTDLIWDLGGSVGGSMGRGGDVWGGGQWGGSADCPPPIELPVRMLTADEQRYEVVENQTVFLHCRTFGAPAPNVEW